ncbi:hypothetical protein [Granulosicoccus antarcticus]|uniref:Uncharacterized protein n=1 Tax=Granulosicoccus antarcticus IMCC3135 TaxID=1192854 RepID=A0A2Z2NYD6_9GAMM|nr:hypothetical protein [Granulosicoccus antarcticus]ASJ76323.1 hypothetical protein IMCC3135_31375 [Granulosicoccus antarcticus IMCC3135]
MTYTTINMETNADKFWSEMPLGAKVAGGIVAVALIGASLVASVFLAGAALFGALVMMVYGALAGKRKRRVETRVDAEEYSDVVKAES